MGRQRTYLRAPVIGIVTLAFALAAACSATASGAPPAPPTPTIGPPPPTPTARFPLLETDREAFYATAEAEGRIWRTTGTTTAGRTIEIAGRQIKLPDDAYILHHYTGYGYGCTDLNDCPVPPVYQLARWNSTVWVDNTGTMREEELAPSEEHAFDFLREALN